MPRNFRAIWIPLAILPAFVAGCSSGEPESEAPDEVVALYTVRGQVVAFEDDQTLGPTVSIHHEPIPSFMSQGKVVGMKAMTMSFPLAEGLDLSEIEPDAIVEFQFEVTYDPGSGLTSSYEVVEIVRLPDDTELIFDEPADEAPASPSEASPDPQDG